MLLTSQQQAIVVGPLSSRSKFEHIVAGSLAGLLFVALSFGFCARIEHLFAVVVSLRCLFAPFTRLLRSRC